MIYSIKAADKCQTSDLWMTYGFDDMIMNGEKSSFSRMMFDIGFEPMTYGSESECATHYTTAPHKNQNICGKWRRNVSRGRNTID